MLKNRYVVYTHYLFSSILNLLTQVVTIMFLTKQPLLIQFRMFFDGYAVKGTFLLNKKVSLLSFFFPLQNLFASYSLMFRRILAASSSDCPGSTFYDQGL